MDPATKPSTDKSVDRALACIIGGAQTQSSPSNGPNNERDRILRELNLLRLSHQTFNQRLRRHIADTTRRLNSHNPIHRLPYELLVRTFAFTSTIGPQHEYLKHLVWIGLVSKDWSRVVFETPSLWARISSRYDEEANRAAILRSAGHPLLVDYSDHDCWTTAARERNAAFFPLAAREVYRWQRLRFHIGYQSALPFLRDLIFLSAPRLEEIKISCREPARMGPIAGMQGHIDIFRGGTDRLRHLDLCQFPILWSSQLLSGLETLKISASNLSHHPSTSHITDVLRRCPKLLAFELQYQGEIDHHTSVATRSSEAEAIHLPHVTSFTLDLDDMGAFKHIIASVRIPACARFALGCRSATCNIFPNEAHHIVIALLAVIRRLSCIELGLSASSLALVGWGDGCDPVIDIYLAHSSPWEELAWLTKPTATSVLWPSIEANISCDDPLPFPQIADLLCNMPSIVKLELVGNSDSYISQLSHPILNKGVYEWVLPNLRELWFEDCPENSLQLFLDLVGNRQGGVDMDGGDGVPLVLPKKLEKLYVRGPHQNSMAGSFYTALRGLNEGDWDSNVVEW
ncbi:hypothetical protein FRB95_007070 [Tulasnella sp. JGI-2019a]|nr:hypothetical protein FRB95_007070 [Tulasnella sp. JGI-2019a]